MSSSRVHVTLRNSKHAGTCGIPTCGREKQRGVDPGLGHAMLDVWLKPCDAPLWRGWVQGVAKQGTMADGRLRGMRVEVVMLGELGPSRVPGRSGLRKRPST